MKEAPLRIECFDISNLQGTQMVASMVVFEDGVPKKSEYRRFEINLPENGTLDDKSTMLTGKGRLFESHMGTFHSWGEFVAIIQKLFLNLHE